ncbi:hypothetical protein Hanom_Chr17g01534011 [Helianthus anomalus]
MQITNLESRDKRTRIQTTENDHLKNVAILKHKSEQNSRIDSFLYLDHICLVTNGRLCAKP